MSDSHEITLNVEGMSCGSCVRHVEHALGKVPGVARVAVDHARGEVRVVHDPAAAPVALLVRAVEGAGYDVRAPEPATAGGHP